MTREKSPNFRAFFDELSKSGFEEGSSLIVGRFDGGGISENYKATAEEVVKWRPDIIMSISDRMTKLIKDATTSIPIVALTSDPVSYGLARSLAHPGGNVTGIMVNSSPEIFEKRIEFLREIVPDTRGVFQLTSRTLWESPLGSSVQAAVEKAGLQLIGPPVESPHREPQYSAAVAAAAEKTKSALVTTAVENFNNMDLIIRLVNEHRIVAFYPMRDYVVRGGLIGHDIDLVDLNAHVGQQVSQILRGTDVGSIPFYQPLRLKISINLASANAAGISIPASILARADEVIE
ncbi:ABC transporter substrate-binding protein [Methylobacterium sp. PvR107]|uniref:ABC transporter substrate-binding protein n=1 Tax=Methylobacterium sp. PvR107 TaxID=2806597 RepID=UPI001AEAB393|nr:ABC transporter substrate-binding protein [Methylobacterium sp. PvR107]MBP1180482.1 putative ABC transport system substrate-binding protein [Methylobacterium sp. PvR107]